jgi:hypothetical protein
MSGRRSPPPFPGTEIERTTSADRRNYRVEFGKIESRLGFRCERTLESGIEEILEAVRSSAIQDFSTEEFNNQVATRAYAQTANGKSSPLRELAALTSREAKQTPYGSLSPLGLPAGALYHSLFLLALPKRGVNAWAALNIRASATKSYQLTTATSTVALRPARPSPSLRRSRYAPDIQRPDRGTTRSGPR